MAKKNFNNFNIELENVLSAAETGMEKAMTELQKDTQMLTHVQTGALRRSWTHDTKRNSDGTIEGAVGSNLVYAPVEDDRHGNLSVAVEQDRIRLLNMIANEIKKAAKG